MTVNITNEQLAQAMVVIRETRRASTSALQRRMRLGYTAAAAIMDELERLGFVGPARGSEPREILTDLDSTTNQPETAKMPKKLSTDVSLIMRQEKIESQVLALVTAMVRENMQTILTDLHTSRNENEGKGEVPVKITVPLTYTGSVVTVECAIEWQRQIKHRDDAIPVTVQLQQIEMDLG